MDEEREETAVKEAMCRGFQAGGLNHDQAEREASRLSSLACMLVQARVCELVGLDESGRPTAVIAAEALQTALTEIEAKFSRRK